ncbi:hypothetical protein GYB59_02175 [bacterium]|nr:hypothetical protein [bacterium]
MKYDLCFVSKERGTVIDLLHPETGLTIHFGNTLEETRKEYPDAEQMLLDDFCEWKASQQRTSIKWNECTEEEYRDALECLPPAKWCGESFLMGEAYDHDAGSGQPRYRGYRYLPDAKAYQTSSRPMTVREFKETI